MEKKIRMENKYNNSIVDNLDLSNTLPKIEVWGDSILLGVSLDEVVDKYSILKNNAISLCSKTLKMTIENFSKFGCTVEKGKKRLCQSLSRGNNCDVAILEYGGNDCNMLWDKISAHPERKHAPITPLKIFSTQIQEIIDALLAHGITPLLTSLPPLQPEWFLNWVSQGLDRSNILKFLGDVHYIYRHQELYSLEISKLAIDNKCGLIDIRAAFLEYRNYYELLCRDGMHPNEKGQLLIRKTFIDYVSNFWPNLELIRN